MNRIGILNLTFSLHANIIVSPIVNVDFDDRNVGPLWEWRLVTGESFLRSCGYLPFCGSP